MTIDLSGILMRHPPSLWNAFISRTDVLSCSNVSLVCFKLPNEWRYLESGQRLNVYLVVWLMLINNCWLSIHRLGPDGIRFETRSEQPSGTDGRCTVKTPVAISADTIVIDWRSQLNHSWFVQFLHSAERRLRRTTEAAASPHPSPVRHRHRRSRSLLARDDYQIEFVCFVQGISAAVNDLSNKKKQKKKQKTNDERLYSIDIWYQRRQLKSFFKKNKYNFFYFLKIFLLLLLLKNIEIGFRRDVWYEIGYSGRINEPIGLKSRRSQTQSTADLAVTELNFHSN